MRGQSSLFDRGRAALTLAAVALFWPGAAGAVETITMTAASGYSPVAAWVKVFQSFFMPEVNRRLEAAGGEYRIEWVEAFSGTVVKPRGELEAVETGIADIAIVVTAFHVDKVPLYNVAFATPFVTTDLELVLRTVDQLSEQFPEMKNSWLKFNQVYLACAGTVDRYQVVTNKPVKTLEDFAGVKIGGAGPNLLWLEGLGATGVNSNLGEFYNGIQNGIFDGVVVWPEAAANFKLHEVAPYYLQADIAATNSFAVTVNKDVWDGLPEPVRQVLQQTATAYRDELARTVLAQSKISEQVYLDHGGQFTKLGEEDRVRWAKLLPPIAGDWADAAERQGLPGRAVLKAYMDVMRANQQPIARQWDQ